MSESAAKAVALKARWVIPIDQPPINGGMVTVAGGRIIAVGENASGEKPRDLGDVALLPGLVNAHTHLEFSLLDKPLGQRGIGFADWIATLVKHRREQAKALFVETDGFQRFRRRAAQAGLAESRNSGVVALGDIATPGWPRECFPAEGVSATIFLELLGLDPQREDELLAMAQSFVLDVQDAAGGVRPGLSPHALYTVSPSLVQRVCKLSAAERCAVAMHLGESAEELDLLASQSGALVETLRSLVAWQPESIQAGSRPLDYLKMLSTAHRALVIHGNYLAADEVQFLAAHRDGMSVVYCPRTHAFFGHPAYPLAEMLAAGVRIAIGTDSRASNPDLRLLDELRHISRHHPGVAPNAILRMGTLSGAEALGIASEYGSITVGKRSPLMAVRLPSGNEPPMEAILASTGGAKAVSTQY